MNNESPADESKREWQKKVYGKWRKMREKSIFFRIVNTFSKLKIAFVIQMKWKMYYREMKIGTNILFSLIICQNWKKAFPFPNSNCRCYFFSDFTSPLSPATSVSVAASSTVIVVALVCQAEGDSAGNGSDLFSG